MSVSDDREPLLYGYCRVSTPSQNIERQERNILRKYPTAICYREYYTGMAESSKRKEWNKLLRRVESGDTIIFDSVSRMSRNSKEGITDYFLLYDRGIDLIFLKEPQINTAVYRKAIATTIPTTGTMSDIILNAITEFLHALAKDQIEQAFRDSEREVLDLRQRTKEGMETARRAGKQIGRPPDAKIVTKKSIRAKDLIVKLSKEFDGAMKDTEVIPLIGISPNSYYKYKRELKEERLEKEIAEYEARQQALERKVGKSHEAK